MPAVITHHIFGEDASSLLAPTIISGQEELLAFLLGCQGTDPLWALFSTTPAAARASHLLASKVHEGRVTDVLLSLRESVSHLRNDDAKVGRAFALGMTAHYLLDVIAHPLVYAQQHDIIAADPSLKDAENEVHAIIESDLDSWMLWETRGQTVLDVPCANMLERTDRIDGVAGSLISQMAWEVFGIELGAAEYGRAVSNYQLMYRLIDPPSDRAARTLQRLERMGRPYSRLAAQTHPLVTSDECTSANLDHRLWRNPFTGEASRASFPDLFHDALIAWPAFSRRFVEGDRQRLEAMVDGINYYGQPS